LNLSKRFAKFILHLITRKIMNHPFGSRKSLSGFPLRKSFATLSLLASGLAAMHAQNTSFNADAIPLFGGNFNAGFGNGILVAVTGNNNVAVGHRSMASTTTGFDNTAGGYFSLAANTTGNSNTVLGARAMELGAAPSFNTAIGAQALRFATGASENTAVGYQAMTSTTGGGRNAALGMRALANNINGSSNSAVGAFALTTNTSGNSNTALGREALSSNNTGSANTAVGLSALFSTTSGGGNTGIGHGALAANVTGTTNSSLGIASNVSAAALTNATAIGANTIVNASNKVRFGNAAVTVVEGPVVYTVSDGRFKTNVRTEDVKGLDFIQRLRPVVYNFDTRALTEHWTQSMPEDMRTAYLATDFGPSTAIRQSGFIAQEVEQAAKAAGYDFNGVHTPVDAHDNYSVSYSQFVVPLVKAVQEQQAQIEAQAAQGIQQQAQIARQQAQIDELQAQVRQLLAAGSGADMRQDASGLEVFPNPSPGRFSLRITPMEQGQWEVYDQQGKQVQHLTLTPGQGEYTIDLSGMASGSYLLRLRSGDTIVASKQLLVK
jgi:hypothetical protein